jgi:hypothetical protein
MGRPWRNEPTVGRGLGLILATRPIPAGAGNDLNVQYDDWSMMQVNLRSTLSLKVKGIAAALLTGAIVAVGVPSASAYTYDYTMYEGPGTGYTRNVPHDYRYLRNTVLGVQACVERSLNGQWFCGLGQGEHHYVDGCNPANCLSFYKFESNNASALTEYIHEEWV